MKGSEYIARVVEDIKATEYDRQNVSQGAFLRAALSIIEEVESPMKEQAFVQLATVSLAKSAAVGQSSPIKRVA